MKKINKIAAIHYYNEDSFNVGIIQFRENNKIIYIDFNIYGEYDGIVFQTQPSIESISYSNVYLKYMEKIIDKTDISDLVFNSEIEIIKYAMDNNRVLKLYKRTRDDVEEDFFIKVLGFDGLYIQYRKYERYGKLYKSINKIRISNIVLMKIDSKSTKIIEKIREE